MEMMRTRYRPREEAAPPPSPRAPSLFNSRPRTPIHRLIHVNLRDPMTRFANILETIGNTPVVKIGKLAPPGIDLYVKIEAFNPLGSVKDRLALGVIEAAERSGALRPGQTVIEATSGNTGIGLAMVCAA